MHARTNTHPGSINPMKQPICDTPNCLLAALFVVCTTACTRVYALAVHGSGTIDTISVECTNFRGGGVGV